MLICIYTVLFYVGIGAVRAPVEPDGGAAGGGEKPSESIGRQGVQTLAAAATTAGGDGRNEGMKHISHEEMSFLFKYDVKFVTCKLYEVWSIFPISTMEGSMMVSEKKCYL